MDSCNENIPSGLTGSSLRINQFTTDQSILVNAVQARELILLSPDNELPDVARLLRTQGWRVLSVPNITALESLTAAKECHVGLVCLDKLDDSELANVEEYLLRNRHTEWIALVSSQALHVELVCKFIKCLCFDYHLKPVDINRLLASIGHAHGKAMLGAGGWQASESESVGRFGMIGSSSVMKELYRKIEKIHSVDEPILIGGESGTGKELVARAIHQLSARCNEPFITVNCGALPSNLIQSELFGHERGAFTGAHQRKIGRIEAAASGTIFLDEIGDLPMELQVNLLHFIQNKTIERVGSNTSITVDARVIAATHVNLPKAIAEGRFREDLYYRINVLHVTVPPLRERGSDISLLAREYFKRFSHDKKHPAQGFSQQALRAVKLHAWPGNVRELINRIRSAIVMSENHLLQPADLGFNQQADKPNGVTLEYSRGKADAELLRQVLNSNHDNVLEAARELGISRATMYRLIKKFREKMDI